MTFFFFFATNGIIKTSLYRFHKKLYSQKIHEIADLTEGHFIAGIGTLQWQREANKFLRAWPIVSTALRGSQRLGASAADKEADRRQRQQQLSWICMQERTSSRINSSALSVWQL